MNDLRFDLVDGVLQQEFGKSADQLWDEYQDAL